MSAFSWVEQGYDGAMAESSLTRPWAVCARDVCHVSGSSRTSTMIQFAIHLPRHTVSSPCYHVALISALCSADVGSWWAGQMRRLCRVFGGCLTAELHPCRLELTLQYCHFVFPQSVNRRCRLILMCGTWWDICVFAYKGEPGSVESLLLASAFCWWPLTDPHLLVLKLERVRVLLGSHAESGPLAGGGTRNVVKRYCASALNHGAVDAHHGAVTWQRGQ